MPNQHSGKQFCKVISVSITTRQDRVLREMAEDMQNSVAYVVRLAITEATRKWKKTERLTRQTEQAPYCDLPPAEDTLHAVRSPLDAETNELLAWVDAHRNEEPPGLSTLPLLNGKKEDEVGAIPIEEKKEEVVVIPVDITAPSWPRKFLYGVTKWLNP